MWNFERYYQISQTMIPYSITLQEYYLETLKTHNLVLF